MNILYIGKDTPNSTAAHRLNALYRLGHQVTAINPFHAYRQGRFWSAFHYKTGYIFVSKIVEKFILDQISDAQFDVAFINHGENIGPTLLQKLKNHAAVIINYNVDDPYGGRDGNRWKTFLKSVKHYDLIVVLRDENIQEAANFGSKKVLREYFCYDPLAHKKLPETEIDRLTWTSQVTFVGTWMPERGPFMARLIELGIPLAIYGDNWHKSKFWPQIKSHFKGNSLYGEEYVKALQYSTICLCLLSKGNRDQQTTRTFEIPFIGSLLCAQRTPEHLKLYREGEEAIFWSNADECAEQCLELLKDPEKIKRIAQAGHSRVKLSTQSNDEAMARILSYALKHSKK